MDLLRHSWLAVTSLFEFVEAAIQFITVVICIDLVEWPAIEIMQIIVVFILVLSQLFHVLFHLILVKQRRWNLLPIPCQFLR